MEIFALVVLTIAACILLLGRRSSAPRSRSTGQGSDNASLPPYAAVSIHCEKGACDSARAINDKRYLLREAPVLPLAGCTSRNCTCRYERHEDRRSSAGDRRARESQTTTEYVNEGYLERRLQRGRRSTDLVPA